MAMDSAVPTVASARIANIGADDVLRIVLAAECLLGEALVGGLVRSGEDR